MNIFFILAKHSALCFSFRTLRDVKFCYSYDYQKFLSSNLVGNHTHDSRNWTPSSLNYDDRLNWTPLSPIPGGGGGGGMYHPGLQIGTLF